MGKLDNIINPVETIDKKICEKKLFYTITLFPFINGISGWNVQLTKEQFFEFGQFMNKLHSSIIPNEYLKVIPNETYSQIFTKNVKNILLDIKYEKGNGPIINDFYNELKANKNVIMEMINFLECNLSKIFSKKHNICLCHGDIHAGNLLLENNKFYVVDWDTIILAPKEKDLMFIGGGIGNKWNTEEEVKYFYKGYGEEIDIDEELIKYYKKSKICVYVMVIFMQAIYCWIKIIYMLWIGIQ